MAFLALAYVLSAPPMGPVEAAEDAPAVRVRVDEVKREPYVQAVTVIGRLVARRRGVVAARTEGSVQGVAVQVGDRVRKGDLLARIDPSRLKWRRDLGLAEVAQATASLANAEAQRAVVQAQIASAEARVRIADQELRRLEGLKDSAAFPQGRYEDKGQELVVARSTVAEYRARLNEAEARIDESLAELDRAQANLRLAQDDLAHAEIRAPYDAVVTLRHTEAGAYLDVGDPVVTLVNDRDLEIEAEVPFDRLAPLRPGVRVEVAFDEGSRWSAAVRAVGVEEDPKSRTRPVRFTPAWGNSMAGMADGQSVVLYLPAGRPREVVSVHKDAVIRNRGQPLVFVVVDGVAELRPVELGEAVGTRFEVLTGLKPGDIVVVRGNERLQPGQAVTF
ncbi:MAG: efflux RND transporter periplasmic adaptor subunit [Alphaproteobacteria bacterium]